MTVENGRLVLHLSVPLLVLLVVVLASAFGLVALAVLISPSADLVKITTAIAEGNAIGRVVALVIIVPAIFVLSVLDRVNGAAAIAALSAIAGYVLGGIMPK
jgi:hypothetical protein